MARRFEWDADKAAANVRKHGVSFDTATRVFDDPRAVIEQDRIEGGEQRWQTIGTANGLLLLLVAHTLLDDANEEIVRIISARRASKLERRKYDQEAR